MLRRYAKSAAMAATGQFGDSALFWLEYLLRLLRVAVLLSLWRMLFAGRGAVSGMTLGAVLTYTLVAEAFAEQLSARTGLTELFWEGSIATRFLQPVGLVAQMAADMAGRWAVGFGCFSLPLLLLSPLLGVNPLPASATAGALFVISLGLAISIGMAIDFVFASIMVRFELALWNVDRLRGAMGTVLSGSMLPLALLPWGLGGVFQWLPFASMASAPLRIYTGTGSPLPLLAVQAAWCALLWPLANMLWERSREKVVSYGG
jgi:ABC-2 type transport system permease protein